MSDSLKMNQSTDLSWHISRSTIERKQTAENALEKEKETLRPAQDRRGVREIEREREKRERQTETETDNRQTERDSRERDRERDRERQ